ncbi:hypothetical protein PIB30_075662 [Stylosanthes scabra]|uniref:Uncharacterized protein n=1 Tax=Stylosanthes scabra TaxID=79078 RepID=A0ABU6USJ6_9FABA|nr:hypothetical protein [Stylosanthes scabra]
MFSLPFPRLHHCTLPLLIIPFSVPKSPPSHHPPPRLKQRPLPPSAPSRFCMLLPQPCLLYPTLISTTAVVAPFSLLLCRRSLLCLVCTTSSFMSGDGGAEIRVRQIFFFVSIRCVFASLVRLGGDTTCDRGTDENSSKGTVRITIVVSEHELWLRHWLNEGLYKDLRGSLTATRMVMLSNLGSRLREITEVGYLFLSPPQPNRRPVWMLVWLLNEEHVRVTFEFHRRLMAETIMEFLVVAADAGSPSTPQPSELPGPPVHATSLCIAEPAGEGGAEKGNSESIPNYLGESGSSSEG